MPEIMNVTNPVPGLDRIATDRNIQLSPEQTPIQNIVDPTRISRPDGRTEQQDAGSENVRYDSNFQTFLQQLRGAPDIVQALSDLFMGRGTVVTSGMSAGIAEELSQVMEMMRMDPKQLLQFLTDQFKSGSRFTGPLFALLRNAYTRASSDSVQRDILQFLKNYIDYSSTKHIEGNLLRNLRGMADSMPASWAGKLIDLTAQLENGIAAGDRKGNLTLLQREIFPHMSAYITRTHDMGTPRALLSLLSLDVARYENGSVDNLLESFRKLTSYGTLKQQLGNIDDQSLLQLLQRSQFSEESTVSQLTDHLAEAASRALRGEGNAQVQEVFQQLVNAMLINESVYMPINHYIIPLEWDGRMLFSEMWVDPNVEETEEEKIRRHSQGYGGGGGYMRFLFKIDVQALGLFDIVLSNRNQEVSMLVSCPDPVVPFSKQVEQTLTTILKNNGLTPAGVTVRRMERPLTLTEVFPKLFEGKNSINVKI